MSTVHEIERKLDQIIRKQDEMFALLSRNYSRSLTIMADLTALQAKVQAATDVEQSAILLLQQLSADLKAAATDPAKVQALADELDAKTQALAAAIVANTPAAPAPPAPTPVPAPTPAPPAAPADPVSTPATDPSTTPTT